ncbi:hypothetical protein [Rubritalea tangerina]|uniref:hypothetical protein n=1 Tax=Rubritalea tangerina TaxID=430798 RepID=UPI00360B899B
MVWVNLLVAEGIAAKFIGWDVAPVDFEVCCIEWLWEDGAYVVAGLGEFFSRRF